MSELTNPHDRFFKETFSRIEVARDLLANYLPPEVAALLNLDTLEARSDSFIDPDLQEQFADLLYKVTLKNGDPAYVYVLLEHKSRPDRGTPFQVLRYKVRISAGHFQPVPRPVGKPDGAGILAYRAILYGASGGASTTGRNGNRRTNHVG